MKWHRYSCCFFHLCSQMICRHCSEQQELLSLVREGGEGSRQSLSFPLNFCTCLLCFACQHNTTPWFCCHQLDIILFSVVWKLRSRVFAFVCLIICIVTKKDILALWHWVEWTFLVVALFVLSHRYRKSSWRSKLLMNQNINETQWWWKWDLVPHCSLYELDIGPGSPLCTISPIRCSTPLQNICFLQRTSFVGHFLLQPQSPLSDLKVFCTPANWAARIVWRELVVLFCSTWDTGGGTGHWDLGHWWGRRKPRQSS